ncbi:MAG: hypothetical protein KAS64_11725 [Spirochaetes bacterium]|nr:hypothetical protein [Spirochaetota bacterium]
MAKKITDSEINAALSKLKEQYNIYAERYDKSLFNINRFEDRYMESLKIGIPTDTFLAGEIKTFQELKKMAEEKYAPKNTAMSDRAEEIFEEYQSRIEKYPVINFNSRADEETRRLTGMIKYFYENFYSSIPSAYQLEPGSESEKLFQIIEPRINNMIIERSGILSPYILDLSMQLDKITASQSDRERIKKEYFKETGFLFNLMADLFKSILHEKTSTDPDKTGRALDYVENALYDFRISDFKLNI